MTSPAADSDRVAFFVDGFNVYHSVCRAAQALPDRSVKWLDLQALFRNYLYLLGPQATLARIVYFTAYAYHLTQANPGKITRHKAFTRALSASGVEVRESHFKRKDAWDTLTGTRFVTYEEKETDVAIACTVLEGAALNEFDTAVLVTGDTDMKPAVLTFRRLYPHRRILFAFPYDRKNRELAASAPESFSLSAESYAKYQFADQVRLPSGKFVTKPGEW